MATRKRAERTRRVLILVLPGSFSLDVLGTYEIFQSAARMHAMRSMTAPADPTDSTLFEGMELAYQVELVGARQGAIETAGGTPLFATCALADVRGRIDTFAVSGGNVKRMMRALRDEPALTTELTRVAQLSRRVVSICTGSFVLAALGLLDGRRATTHWAACDYLQTRFPAVKVEREPIYTQDGNIYTSAGASTGMDLTLALVREDLGAELAQQIARWLVLYLQRPGGQAQISLSLKVQEADRQPLRELLAWIVEHPGDDLSVAALAARVGMSVRNFARAFRREVSMTPAAYVESVRVEAARRKLELGRASIEEVASDVGFRSVETLRRAFSRQVGSSPSAYRLRAAGAV